MIFPVRFRIVFMSFLAVFICFIDRVNISVAIIPMQAQFGWSEFQVGIILSSFYFGYIISMTFSGFLADKYGGKIVLAYGLLFWSLFTLITPAFAYSGFFFLILIRILMGLGEGGFGVNHADLGPKYTGSLFGISGSLGMVAAVLSPIIAGIILQATNSWTLIFHLCSGFLIFGGIYYLLFASADKQFD